MWLNQVLVKPWSGGCNDHPVKKLSFDGSQTKPMCCTQAKKFNTSVLSLHRTESSSWHSLSCTFSGESCNLIQEIVWWKKIGHHCCTWCKSTRQRKICIKLFWCLHSFACHWHPVAMAIHLKWPEVALQSVLMPWCCYLCQWKPLMAIVAVCRKNFMPTEWVDFGWTKSTLLLVLLATLLLTCVEINCVLVIIVQAWWLGIYINNWQSKFLKEIFFLQRIKGYFFLLASDARTWGLNEFQRALDQVLFSYGRTWNPELKLIQSSHQSWKNWSHELNPEQLQSRTHHETRTSKKCDCVVTPTLEVCHWSQYIILSICCTSTHHPYLTTSGAQLTLTHLRGT